MASGAASMPSIDAMLGIISNNNQTSAILDNQRAVTESIKNSMERNTQGLSSIVANDADRIVNIVDRNNAFANQNLTTLGSGLKDIIQHGFSSDLAAIERTAAANALTTDRVGNNLSSAI
jgi:predicted phage gp36 major capsid-like protein